MGRLPPSRGDVSSWLKLAAAGRVRPPPPGLKSVGLLGRAPAGVMYARHLGPTLANARWPVIERLARRFVGGAFWMRVASAVKKEFACHLPLLALALGAVVLCAIVIIAWDGWLRAEAQGGDTQLRTSMRPGLSPRIKNVKKREQISAGATPPKNGSAL